MKYTIRQIEEGENEVILQYLDMTSEVQRVLSFINLREKLMQKF